MRPVSHSPNGASKAARSRPYEESKAPVSGVFFASLGEARPKASCADQVDGANNVVGQYTGRRFVADLLKTSGENRRPAVIRLQRRGFSTESRRLRLLPPGQCLDRWPQHCGANRMMYFEVFRILRKIENSWR